MYWKHIMTVMNQMRPPQTKRELSSEYTRMAADEDREAEAREWADALLRDVADEAG